MKNEFEARALRITDVSIKHAGGEHPFDVLQILVGDGMVFINRSALEELQREDYDWTQFKAALKALPPGPFKNEP